jgi:hypothetical protein
MNVLLLCTLVLTSLAELYGHESSNQPAIKPLASKYGDADEILTPVREVVVRTNLQTGKSGSSLSEDELVYASIYPIDTESSVTFDLSQVDFFDNMVRANKEHYLDAKLKLYSLNKLPTDLAFDVVLTDESYRGNGILMQWNLDSPLADPSRCTDLENCWIEVDITDGLLWSLEQQMNVKDWDPSFTVRVSVPIRQGSVAGSFASSLYRGGRFAPHLSIDFRDETGTDIKSYSSGITKPKPGRKQIMKGVKGPKKNPKNTIQAKTGNGMASFNSAARPNQDYANNSVQYYTYIIIDTDDLQARTEPGRKYLVKGVKGPRKKAKNNASKTSNKLLVSSKPATRPNISSSTNFNGIRPNPGNAAAFASSTGHGGGANSGGTNSGPNGPTSNYGQGQGPNGPIVNYGQGQGPNGASVNYDQASGGIGPSVTYSGSSGGTGMNSYWGQAATASASSGSRQWYMNYQVGRCVVSCANGAGAGCGGVANFWDIMFDSLENCCTQMNYWNANCMAGI